MRTLQSAALPSVDPTKCRVRTVECKFSLYIGTALEPSGTERVRVKTNEGSLKIRGAHGGGSDGLRYAALLNALWFSGLRVI